MASFTVDSTVVSNRNWSCSERCERGQGTLAGFRGRGGKVREHAASYASSPTFICSCTILS